MLYLMPGASRPWTEVMALARSSIDRALELDPDLADAHATRGLLLMRDENKACPPDCFRLDLEASEKALRTAIDLNPGLARAHNWLAIVLYAQGDFKAAEPGFERALGYDPMNPALHNNSALFAAYRGEQETAKRIIADFLTDHPDPPGYLLTGLAIISDLYGDFGESLRHAQARQEASGNAGAYAYDIAMAYINLGMLEEAERHLSLADSQDIIGSSTLSVRTGLHLARNESAALAELAGRVSREAYTTYGDRAEWPRWTLRATGRAYSLIGDHARSIEHYELVYRPPLERLDYHAVVDELDGMLFYAYSLESVGRSDEAETVIQAVLEIFGSLEQQGYAALPDLVYVKAVAHALLDERALAIATLRQAVSRGWRRHWRITSDPRWAPLRQEADFNELLAEIRDRVSILRNSLDSMAHFPPDEVESR
jgi:tetratricopeptide (TPR) repeat protein